MSQSCEVKVRFCPPPKGMRRYFTTFYHVEWEVSGDGTITDYLLPEWANLRFQQGSLPESEALSGERLSGSSFPVSGPTSQAIRVTVGSSRLWGIGLLPLGWAKFVGASAGNYANRAIDGYSDPVFASFAPLARSLFGPEPDPQAELDLIIAHFEARLDEPVSDEARIVAIHTALVDQDTSSVAALALRSGTSQRTMEQICLRAFGFSPRLLLRRQRFMRSLSHFMLDPSLKWIGAIDNHYHDQAQFVRDFRQFIGMAPRQYAALPKPLISAVMRERAALAGSPVQTMDSPDGTSLPD